MLNDKFLRGSLMEGDSGGGGGGTALTKDDVTNIVKGMLGTFKTEMTASMKSSFDALTPMFETLTTTVTALKDKVETAPAPAVGDDKNKPVIPPELNAQILKMGKDIERLTNENKTEKDARLAAEQKAKATDKESKLRSELQAFNFANPETAEDVFTILNGKVDFGDDGSLVGDGLPVKDFVKSYVDKRPNLLAAERKGGAGAANGNGRGNTAGRMTLEDIKPGMSVDQQAKAAGEIVAALREGGLKA